MIVNLFSGIVCVFTFFVCCCQSLRFETKKKLYFILYSLIIIILRSLFPIRENLHINLFFAIIIYISIPFLFFKASFVSKMFFVLSYIICSTLCELITMNFFSLFFLDKIISDNIAFGLGLLTTNIILIVLMSIYSLYLKTFSLKNLPKSSLLILSLPITTLLLITNIDDYIQTVNNTNLFGVTVLGLLFSNIACIYIYYKTVVNISKEKELEQALEKKNLEYEAATNLLSQHNVFLHDIRNQSKDMLSLLKNEKYGELEIYINNVYGESTNTFNMINSNCKIVDVLINDRIYIIKSNNIILKTKLENIEFNSLDMMQLEKIFKCIIDLGINECIKSKLSDPYLYIKSKKIENQAILTFTFSSISKITDERIDLEVKTILENHNSFYLIENDKTNNETCISILFMERDN